MIKQDYLIRMILEIITLIANMLIKKEKVRPQQWIEYDSLTEQILGMHTDQLLDKTPECLIDTLHDDPNSFGKLELAAMTMLKISDELNTDELLRKSNLRQKGIFLLQYVQDNSNTFSLQRVQLLTMLNSNE